MRTGLLECNSIKNTNTSMGVTVLIYRVVKEACLPFRVSSHPFRITTTLLPLASILYYMENNQEKKLDSESGSARLGEGKLVRQLKNRHVAMIRYANLSFPPTPVYSYRRLRLLVLEVSSAQVSPSF